MEKSTTLGGFIFENQKDFPYPIGELSALLSYTKLAGKVVNQAINKVDLENIRRKTKLRNVQGEKQARIGTL